MLGFARQKISLVRDDLDPLERRGDSSAWFGVEMR